MSPHFPEGGDQRPRTFIGDAAFSAVGQLRAFQSGNQWIVEGVADLAFALSWEGPVMAADFGALSGEVVG